MTVTYAKLIKTLLKSVSEDHKTDLSDRIAETLIDNTVKEYSGPLPYKRKKRDSASSVTEHFKKGNKGTSLGDLLFEKFESEK